MEEAKSPPPQAKNPAAQALGKLGGDARYAKLSRTAAGRKKLREIAVNASRVAAEKRSLAAKERRKHGVTAKR